MSYQEKPMPTAPGHEQPPAYYPPPQGNQPPPQSSYPPQGYPPPQQGGYAQPQGAYPPPQVGYPPVQGVASPSNVTVIHTGPTCRSCGGTSFTEGFSCCGIALAIIFFPIGLLCCLLMREKKCSHCGST